MCMFLLGMPNILLVNFIYIHTILQAEYILDLQKQLTLLGSEARKDSNGVLTDHEPIPSVNQVDKVCFPSSLTHTHGNHQVL